MRGRRDAATVEADLDSDRDTGRTRMSEQDRLAQVREGVDVVDSAGNRVGTVKEVRGGDPDAVTSAGQDQGGGGIVDTFAGALFDRDIHEQARERLIRSGYVQIDAAGLFPGDRFAAADEVDRVEGDTVHLTVDADSLVG
ncbi:hypothetical protein L600_000300000810 [Isoptericola variabilis J7]|uniref:PRC-barrel domain-containing protein n=2 Tax=Isoptericola TaxID=254250 RepID=F6FRT5_ISOV2|nr:hypothetical protein Isova_1166 [Isoptericola variabilis 225]TWH30528.1 hypothetical protein L600_000300000810 [Isoptericola variabilis J7]